MSQDVSSFLPLFATAAGDDRAPAEPPTPSPCVPWDATRADQPPTQAPSPLPHAIEPRVRLNDVQERAVTHPGGAREKQTYADL